MAKKKAVPADPVRRVRCAIYTRKSNAEGLELNFNSLDSQREAAVAYVSSQRHDGWEVLEERYDDPAYSAATTDRPALQRLLTDVERGLVDVVVVYKIDRLSRSLRDFGHLMELFEAHGVSFVSVTQRFDTSSSMGKLTLNILMSFAEFEREVTRERIRDKIAAAKKRGLYTGGLSPLGYDIVDRRLVVNEQEAELVRRIFRRFCALRSTLRVAEELNRDGYRTKTRTTKRGRSTGGKPFNKRGAYDILTNKTYLGLVVHKEKEYPGEHEAIVPQKLWGQAQRVFKENLPARGNRTRAKTQAFLRGLVVCAHCGCAMGPTFTQRHGKVYRYYLCTHASKNGYASCPVKSIAAGLLEDAVVGQLRAVFRSPEVVARVYRETKTREAAEIERLQGEKAALEEELGALKDSAARLVARKGPGRGLSDELRRTGAEIDDVRARLDAVSADLMALETRRVSERDVIAALRKLSSAWDELYPVEKERIVGLLVERIDIHHDSLEIRIRAEGLRSLVAELDDEDAPAVGEAAG